MKLLWFRWPGEEYESISTKTRLFQGGQSLISSNRTWASRLLHAAGQLLSSNRQKCLSCTQHSILDKGKLGLCNSCYIRIPWISQVLCPVCGRYETCQDCSRREKTYFLRSRSAVKYDDAMKELLARYKYRGDERLGQTIGAMLLHAFHLLQADFLAMPMHSVKQVITFVPVSGRRMNERGFNQAEQMAREVAKAVRLPVIPLLRRIRHTDKQSFKSRSQRIGDLDDVFQFDEAGVQQVLDLSAEANSVKIYLVDDVYTTGSTLNQCAMVLKKRLDMDVFGLIWAR
jgi:competence protein ComFC